MAVIWGAQTMKSTNTLGSLSDVITSIEWTAKDSDGDFKASAYGLVALAVPDSENFIAYDSVTKDNAVAWAKTALGTEEVTKIESNIAGQIAKLKTAQISLKVPSSWKTDS